MSEQQLATLGGGCYWCVEAVFQRLAGVDQVVSGFMGGEVENPTYEAVCSGATGHAEVCQISFDPDRIGFEELLEVFWKTHDPTTLNRQGHDVGTQYRSVVFYHDDEQKRLAQQSKARLDESGAFANPIVTEISPASTCYPAQADHQNYFNLNKHRNPYCQMIQYKVDKFEAAFADRLKN